MPDFDRADQILQLAQLLASMPPQQFGGPRIPIPEPKRAQWATELIDKFGVRVHPELGSMALVDDPDGDASMGANQAQRLVPRVDAERMLQLLRDVAVKHQVPEMAALADRIEAAKTPEQRAVVIADIDRENPGLVATARKHFDLADPARVFGQ